MRCEPDAIATATVSDFFAVAAGATCVAFIGAKANAMAPTPTNSPAILSLMSIFAIPPNAFPDVKSPMLIIVILKVNTELNIVEERILIRG